MKWKGIINKSSEYICLNLIETILIKPERNFKLYVTLSVPLTADDFDSAIIALMSDKEFIKTHKLGTFSSPNIWRIIPQLVHYFWLYLKVRRALFVQSNKSISQHRTFLDLEMWNYWKCRRGYCSFWCFGEFDKLVFYLQLFASNQMIYLM